MKICFIYDFDGCRSVPIIGWGPEKPPIWMVIKEEMSGKWQSKQLNDLSAFVDNRSLIAL